MQTILEITPGLRAWANSGRLANKLVTVARVFQSTGEALIKDDKGNFATISSLELDFNTEVE